VKLPASSKWDAVILTKVERPLFFLPFSSSIRLPTDNMRVLSFQEPLSTDQRSFHSFDAHGNITSDTLTNQIINRYLLSFEQHELHSHIRPLLTGLSAESRCNASWVAAWSSLTDSSRHRDNVLATRFRTHGWHTQAFNGYFLATKQWNNEIYLYSSDFPHAFTLFAVTKRMDISDCLALNPTMSHFARTGTFVGSEQFYKAIVDSDAACAIPMRIAEGNRALAILCSPSFAIGRYINS
jgi:hypothetical protein